VISDRMECVPDRLRHGAELVHATCRVAPAASARSRGQPPARRRGRARVAARRWAARQLGLAPIRASCSSAQWKTRVRIG
jgi:hypothetical protein